MAEGKQNLQNAAIIAKLFGVTDPAGSSSSQKRELFQPPKSGRICSTCFRRCNLTSVT